MPENVKKCWTLSEWLPLSWPLAHDAIVISLKVLPPNHTVTP